MCAAKTPKIKDTTEKDKLPILRNPILDGMLGNIAAIRNGRNSLRINLANPLAIPIGGGSPGGGGGGSGVGSSGGGSSGGGASSGGGSGGGFRGAPGAPGSVYQ